MFFLPIYTQNSQPVYMPMFFPSYSYDSSSPSYSYSSSYKYDNYSSSRSAEEKNLQFDKDFSDYYPKIKKEIKDKISADLFQIEPFNNEEMPNLINLINLITEEEKYEEKLFQQLENIVLENANKNILVKHLNIILAGPSGVGKSTIINTILKYENENLIKTGIGIPCTMGEPKYYESEAVSFLRLADSRGIEKTQYRMEELNQSIDKFIKSQLDSENPDYFVHCIWYCITGTRLEAIEMETLKELSRIYKSDSIPVILVYTQAISKQKIEEMEKFIKDNFARDYDFIPILANKEIIIDDLPPINPYGLDKLTEISVLRAKEAVKSSCYEFNYLKTKREVQDIINKKKENLNKILNDIIQEKIEIELVDEGKTKEEIYDSLQNILINIISNHIYIEEGKIVSVQSENLIKDFGKKVIDESIPKFEALFADFIEKQSYELAKKLYDYQNNYSYSYLLNNKKTLDQFKNEKKNDLIEETKKKALMYFYKNLFKYICSLCVEKFQENSENIYKKILEKEEFRNLIVKVIEKDFEDINKNLKL